MAALSVKSQDNARGRRRPKMQRQSDRHANTMSRLELLRWHPLRRTIALGILTLARPEHSAQTVAAVSAGSAQR
eukprot:2574898-Amphidinium_carterae.3